MFSLFSRRTASSSLAAISRGLTAETRRHTRSSKPLTWGAAILVTASASLVFHQSRIYLDAPDQNTEKISDSITDPATDIVFPKTLRVTSKTDLPTFQLLGVGVRTVSFLGIKVYSVGFYADLTNTNLTIPVSATAQEKIEHIVQNTACVIRIVPTRSTSYTHLRDGFIRALTARIRATSLPEAAEQTVQAPLRQFKSMFPNTPLAKGSPMEVLLTSPDKDQRRQRALVIRDMGAVENTWVAEQFMLAYFEGNGISPPLKKMVEDNLVNVGK